jgi:hypothetical protein
MTVALRAICSAAVLTTLVGGGACSLLTWVSSPQANNSAAQTRGGHILPSVGNFTQADLGVVVNAIACADMCLANASCGVYTWFPPSDSLSNLAGHCVVTYAPVGVPSHPRSARTAAAPDESLASEWQALGQQTASVSCRRCGLERMRLASTRKKRWLWWAGTHTVWASGTTSAVASIWEAVTRNRKRNQQYQALNVACIQARASVSDGGVVLSRQQACVHLCSD